MTRAQHQLDDVVARAREQGVLPATAVAPGHDDRPWPVVLLTAFGAWLVAIPLFAAFAMLLGDMVLQVGAAPYVLGLLMLAGAWVLLRRGSVPVFVEQIAVPVALAGAGLLGYGLFTDLHVQAGSAVLCAVTLAFGATVSRMWLRALAGAAAAILFMLALLPEKSLGHIGVALTTIWFTLHGTLAAWLAAVTMQQRDMEHAGGARAASAIEGVGTGWLLATLVALAGQSGMTFMLAGATGSGVAAEVSGAIASEVMRSRGALTNATAFVSVVLALGAAGFVARQWSSLRAQGAPHMAAIGVALVLAVLAWFLPMLGGALVALAACVVTHRWRLAAACGVACAWIVGSFYYQLAWPLGLKAVVLVGAGAVLGLMAWLAMREKFQASPAQGRALAALPRTAVTLAAVTGVAVLAIANIGIWQKEDLIANGKPVYVSLVPVDPRSLMQGDFMQLNFSVPRDSRGRGEEFIGGERLRVIAKKDARNVATLTRIEGDDKSGVPPSPEEFAIELTPKGGRWILVTDAWFFAEGDGPRFARAKFGEFRVDASGRALLVGLADENLQPIKP